MKTLYAADLDGTLLLPGAVLSSFSRSVLFSLTASGVLFTAATARTPATVVNILERREYTGCIVNFKTYTNSIWDKKQRHNPEEKQSVFENTHKAIIDESVFEKVQIIRQNRHRKTKTGKSSMFSGMLYCGDCGEKMYYCTLFSIFMLIIMGHNSVTFYSKHCKILVDSLCFAGFYIY
mgnify:CR=1 FL=1